MAKLRASPYRRTEILKLMESAGWTVREGSKGHMVVSKEGNPKTFTLTDPPHRNAIAEIQKELGLHISQLITSFKGTGQLTPAEMTRRLDLAKRLRIAGFDMLYIVRTCRLDTLYKHGFGNKDLTRPTDEIVKQIFQAMADKQRAKFLPTPVEEEKQEEVTAAEERTTIDLLAEIERRLEHLTRTDKLSLLGNQLDKLEQTLKDSKELKRTAERQLEIINRIIEKLEA